MANGGGTCGERCCCILGGCGCGPLGQRKALASVIAEKTGTENGSMEAAERIFEMFGYGPHVEQMKKLGVDPAKIHQARGE